MSLDQRARAFYLAFPEGEHAFLKTKRTLRQIRCYRKRWYLKYVNARYRLDMVYQRLWIRGAFVVEGPGWQDDDVYSETLFASGRPD